MKPASTTPSPRGSRLRMKRKRLDAICESVYTQNHADRSRDGDDNSDNGEMGELRRSSRVRRAPVVLDVSLPPAKKRKKRRNPGELGKRRGSKGKQGKAKEEEGASEDSEGPDVDTPGIWRSRLRSRSRGRRGGIVARKGRSRRRKKKSFEDVVEDEGNSVVVRPGRIRALSGLVVEGNGSDKDDEEEVSDGKGEGSGADEEDYEDGDRYEDEDDNGDGNADEMKVVEDEGVADDVVFVGEVGGGSKKDDRLVVGEMVSGSVGDEPASMGQIGGENEKDEPVVACEMVGGNGEEEGSVGLGSGVMLDHDEMMEDEEKKDGDVEESVNGVDMESERDTIQCVEADRNLVNEVKEGAVNNEEEVPCKEILVEDRKEPSENKLSRDILRKPRIKQGRKCGLCGCGNDGKPPKRLVQDAGDSDKEAYSGSSASEEPNYDVWDGFGDEPEWLGRLLGPINDRFGIAGVWVHQHCAVWSPEVYFAGLGRLKSVRAALCRGRALKCTRCGRPGATIGCRVDRCPKTYHLPCARANGCIFDHRKFLIACTDHRHLFQPHGYQLLKRIKKLKAKKMKLEIRKQSNDAWRKDVEAEEKWLENCGEDEEFLKRESKRLHRDLLRIAPVYIGGSNAESGQLFEGWESVAGLQDVIQCLKEVVILPLLYPEFFSNLGIMPPRGVLLHGYPGTGKTHVVRALIGSCARGDKRIAYFARKGADCLGKYVGDAERQLRLLFQVAEKCQPSIIFFDEIDGLAPCRTRQQDQTHNSVVSTLLALMDGLKSRGSVIVIGATNRPEAVDPALRRPGRFDREIYFPLPSFKDRAAILSLHTQRWPRPVSGYLLDWIARRTVGFAGADLQALCTQAAIIALKRNFPLQEVLSATGQKASGYKLPPIPGFAVEERDWLEALACASPPCSRRVDGIAVYDLVSSPLPIHLISPFLRPLLTLLVSLYLDERLWLPNSFLRAAKSVESVVISSLEKKNMPSETWWSHINHLLEEADMVKELQRRLSYTGILIGDIADLSTEAKDDIVDLETPKLCSRRVHSHVLRSTSPSSGTKSGFRVLIAGNPRSGQRHLASCFLQCFVGNIEIHKVDLATFSHEGHGDMVLGITQILLKCSSLPSCFIFMPRIDLWAVEITKESDDASLDESYIPHVERRNLDLRKPAEIVDHLADTQIVSHLWSSFVEQLESICVSTSLMILATSDIPFQGLPEGIRQFFSSNVSNHSNITCPRTMPRFCVDLGADINHRAMLRLSAAELLSHLIRSYVQVVHQGAHSNEPSYQDINISNSAKACSKVEQHTTDEATAYLNRDSSAGVAAPPNIRSLRGKPSFLLAMSTFGYQILRYPHFAELCWVTSKLKDGPSADISGSLKGWPFNSCIIRPYNPLDKVLVTNTSGHARNKEISGVVRGLVAVGLLAYRGEYKSLREVSFEVRKVLQLLVGQISERIQSGKERHQYIRLLSQVAYLEDVVNNWTFTLQSLDVDAQNKRADSKPPTIDLPESLSCVESLQGKKCEGNGSDLACKHLEIQTEHANVILEHESDKENGLRHSGCTAAHEEDSAPQQITPCDGSMLAKCNRSVSANDFFSEENGTNLGQSDPENTKDLTTLLEGDSESLNHPDGHVSRTPVSHSDLGNSGVPNLLGSSACNFSDQIKETHGGECETRSGCDEPVNGGHAEEINGLPSVSATFSAEPPVTCSYHSCSRCLAVLHNIIEELLAANLGLASDWSVEDVHDVVESLSVELLSAIRKVDLGGSSDSALVVTKTDQCGCQSEGRESNSLAATECGCHSIDGGATYETNYPTDLHFGVDMNFVFRDGVLVPVNSNKDVDFHCTYERLCLCPLTKLVLKVARR